MLLQKIKLENFKKFDEMERDFASGINVVKGRLNEMGKSTFLDGIIVALFENPRSASRELDKYQKWGVKRRYKTAIQFQAALRDYVLEKDFETKSLRLSTVKTGNEWTTPAQVFEKIGELLGTQSAKLFLSTSCVRQDQIRDIESGKKEISQNLEEIVTGGAEETAASQIIQKLDKQIDGMKKGLKALAKTPGLIAELIQQVNNLQQEIGNIREEVDNVEKRKLKLVEISQQLVLLESNLDKSEALLEKNRRRREIEEKIGNLEKEYERIDKRIGEIAILQKAIDEADSKLQGIKGFGDRQKVLEVRRQLYESKINQQATSEDLLERNQELRLAQEQFGKNKLLVGLSSNISLIIGTLLGIAGFLGIFFHTAIATVGIMGLLLIAASFWAKSSIVSRRGNIPSLRSRIAQMEGALKRYEEQDLKSLTEVNCNNVEEFKQREKEYEELMKTKEASQNKLEGTRGGQSAGQLEEQRREILKRLGVEQEKLTEDLRSTVLSPEEYVRYENDVKKLKEEKSTLERAKLESEVKIGNARFDAEDLAQKEEILETIKNKLSRAQKKARVLELAKDFMERARTETLVSVKDLLQAEIQNNFEIFSNGKYKQVAVNEGTLDFQIFSDEKDNFVQPEELSGGSVDEFYLACRLALVKLLYGELAPPLILDDPFVNFDQVRLKRTLDLLRQLSQKQQIIIFTLGDAYDGIADKILELT